MARMGRPFESNIDLELLRRMIEKGFTKEECCKYFNTSKHNIQYYRNHYKMLPFRYKLTGGIRDKKILELNKQGLTQTEIANSLGIYQERVSKIIKKYNIFEKEKKERYEWLEKVTAKDVEKD